jgi:hypothetical protein
MKQVKKTGKKNEFLLDVLNLFEEGLNTSQITNRLSISKQKLNYYIAELKRQNLVKKVSYGVWEVKSKEVKNFSLGLMKPTTNLHALQLSIPILEGKIESDDWTIKNKLNNWLPKYKGLEVLGGLTIRNNNNKSISVFIKSRDIKDLNEIDNLAFKVRSFIFEYFKHKENVILDIMNCETKNLDIATEDKQAEGMVKKGDKFKLTFDKKAEKIFENDKIQSKAWIDGSPFTFTAETNDKEWKREYLKMPFSIKELRESLVLLEDYNMNLKLHKEVQAEQLKTQKKMQEVLERIDNRLNGN